VVFKSSAHYYGCEQDDPAFFTEAMRRPHQARTAIERDIVEAESAVREFAERNPRTTVTVLRFANGLGPAIRTSHTRLFQLPVVPTILGFDPRYQFIHEDDIANCLEHAVRYDLDGIYNCAGDGVLALSEVISLLGRLNAPVLSPVGTGLALTALRRTGINIPVEMRNQLRFGRGLDNRRYKATGFRYRYTTREAVLKLREHQRLAPLLARDAEPYRYEEEVEEFLRRSPNVRAAVRGAAERRAVPRRVAAPPGDLADLKAAEVIALLDSLDQPQLVALREHEAAGAARRTVLAAIDTQLGRTLA
jgi:UDP-glucose 4-epimerase